MEMVLEADEPHSPYAVGFVSPPFGNMMMAAYADMLMLTYHCGNESHNCDKPRVLGSGWLLSMTVIVVVV